MKKMVIYLLCLCLGSAAFAESDHRLSQTEKNQKLEDIRTLSRDLKQLKANLENAEAVRTGGYAVMAVTTAVAAMFLNISIKKLLSLRKANDTEQIMKYIARLGKGSNAYIILTLGEGYYLQFNDHQISSLIESIQKKQISLELASNALETAIGSEADKD
jgi:tRNA threonylcarbamoyladenosine modification (KEOPS) complex Cgi121 subunit